MLQQTQVTTVLGYYPRFMQAFPTWSILAESPLDAVLTHWSGLGYYRRARHLWEAARHIATLPDFPANAQALATLPGIGRSTAAAISVFAYGHREAILDGNVKRILTRYFSLTDATPSELWQRAEELLPSNDIHHYTQGLMDLGSLICTRTRPDCSTCPLNLSCSSYVDHVFTPPATNRTRPARLIWHSRLLLIQNRAGSWLATQRPSSGIWADLWSFPEEKMIADSPSGYSLNWDLSSHSSLTLPPFIHLLTHRQWHFHPLVYRLDETTQKPSSTQIQHWLSIEQISRLAIPAPVRKLLPILASILDE